MATIVPAFAGGILIGLSATALLWINGRLAGVSNILAGLVKPSAGEWLWRLQFVAGLWAGGGAVALFAPQWLLTDSRASLTTLAIGGFLAGLGAALANGCTSGHGVCGLSRRSLRSTVATLTFMAAGMITVKIVNALRVL